MARKLASAGKTSARAGNGKCPRPGPIKRWKKRAAREIDQRVKSRGLAVFLLQVFAAPILAGCGFIVMFLLLGSTTFLKLLGLIFAYLMPPMGKESIIPIGVVVLGIDPLVMALSITFWDLTVALFLLWNFNFIRLVPVLGPWVARAECKSSNYLERKTWVRRLATAGLALYCCIPLEGSGAVVGTIVGNLIGLRPRMIVLAILAGTLTSTMVIAYFADVIIDIFNGM